MPPIDRREYLKSTGSAAVAPLVAASDSPDGSYKNPPENPDKGVTDDVRPPDGLRVEYTNDPLGTETSHPRLNWVFNPTYRGQAQSAYRVLVASSEERLHGNRADKWDSGKVLASNPTHVEYNGEPLASGERVYWKVRVWDEEDRRSDWSDPAHWEMGLLDQTDWEADWIGAQQRSDQDRIQTNQKQWTDYVVDVAFTLEKGPFGVLFRTQDSYNCYLSEIDPGGNGEFDDTVPTFRLRVREHGQWETVTEVPIAELLPPGSIHQTHRLRVQIEGDTFETYLDDRLVDRTSDGTHTRGRPGFYVPDGALSVIHELEARASDGEVLYHDDFSTPQETRTNYSDGKFDDGNFHLKAAGVVLLNVFRPYVSPAPILRTEVEFDKKIAAARAYVSGLGFYELYLNGERVGDQVLDPGRTDYGETVLYATQDVTNHIKNGWNAIGVALGRARFGAVPPTVTQWHRAPWWSDPQLLFQLEVTFADGTTRTVVSDDSWRVTDGPTRFDDLIFGEVYDARREREGWTLAGYDDSEWEPARAVDSPAGDLRAQQVQPVRVADELEPVGVSEPKPGVFVYDFGQQVAGWPELTLDGERGMDVKVKVGEKLNNDGTVWSMSPVNSAEIGEFTYIKDGNGIETWEPRFTYTGFRYVQLEGEGAPDAPISESLVGKVVHSAVTEEANSRFSCSNDLLSQIHENTRWALRNNYHSVPTDTPTYEKRGWGGDAILTNETAIYEFWMPRFHRKRLRDIRDQHRKSAAGSLPDIAPSPLGPNDLLLLLGWESEYPMLVWWMYQYYGDERVLETHYEGMKRYVRYVKNHAATINNLVNQVLYGDWASPDVGRTPVDDLVPREKDICATPAPPWTFCARDGTFFPPEGPNIVANAWFYLDSKLTARVASLLGYDEEADEFETLAEDIKESFNTAYLHSDDVYRTGRTPQYRQTSNVMPLAFGMVPDDREAAVVENLVTDIMVTHDGHLNTGIHGTKFLLKVLTDNGYHNVAYTVATQRTHPSWGWLIENDRTALNEEWHLEERSRDHHFFGTIVDWFYQDLAGIRPDAPGFEHVEIAPQLIDDLTWVEATTKTIRGEVGSRWEQSEDSLTLNITIPGTATGTILIPDLGAAKVRVAEGDTTIWEHGRPARPFPAGIESVERTDDAVEVEVGAGHYGFSLVPDELHVIGTRSDDGAIFTGGQTDRVALSVTATEPVRVRDRLPDGWTVEGGDNHRVYTVDGIRYIEFEAMDEQVDVTYFAEAPQGASETGQYTFGPIEIAAGSDADWETVSGTNDSVVVVGSETGN